MKKFYTGILIIILLFGSAGIVSAERPIRLIVGGTVVETDTVPIIVKDRILAPMRAIFEALDA